MRDYLFGFTTTRNPSAMAPESRTRFHVFMIESDRQDTHYWSDHPRGRFDSILKRIRQRADGFDGVPQLPELKEDFEPWLAFYRAVKSEKRRADLSDVHSLADELNVSALLPNQRVMLWDAIAENLWIRKNKVAVDTIRAIFVANLVLNAMEDFSEDDLPDPDIESEMRRMLNGKLVLPLPLDNRTQNIRRSGLSAQQKDMLEAAHDRILSGIVADRLIRARNEFQIAVNRFRTAEIDRTRDEVERNEAIVRSELSENLSAEEAERAARSVAVSTGRITTTNREAINAVMADIHSVEAHSLLTPIQAHAASLTAVTDTLDDEIESREQAAGGLVEVAHQAVFLAFGTEFAIEVTIPKGAIILKTHPNSEGGNDIYLTYYHARSNPIIVEVSGRLEAGGNSTATAAEELETNDDRFQTFRLNADPLAGNFVRVFLELRTSVTGAPLVNLDPYDVFAQVPQFDVPDLVEAFVESQQPPPLFGINRLGVIEYRRVEQEVACYVTGQVSRIESIPARTFKRRNSRSFSMTEVEQDVTQEVSSERQSETETVEKNEMQTQMERTLREEQGKSFDFGSGVSIELPGTGSLTTEASFNFNSQSSREDATSQAIEIARSITQKVQEKLIQKTTARRRSLSRKEFEDIIEQGFDNRMGEDHVVCVYRWIDKIMNNYLVNYGKMEVIEFELPEPPRCFIAAQEVQQEEQEFKMRRPKRPRQMGLRGPRSINNRNYRRFSAAYGIELEPPPRQSIMLSRGFADSMGLVGSGDEAEQSPNRAKTYNELAVPEGYVATTVWVEADYEDALIEDGNVFSGGGFISVSVGNSDFKKPSQFLVADLNKLEGTVPVSVMSKGAGAFAVQVTIECRRKGSLYDQWQIQAYSKLMDAYRALKAEYDDKRAEHEEEFDKVVDLNPRFRKQVMERELKRLCISMIADQLDLTLTADHYGAAEEGELPPINYGPSLDRHAELVRFLEQAVNWNLMSYIFYPYFYAKEDRWADKIALEATRDRLFAAFLSSSMGRVLVPIRPGFEAAFSIFLETGQAWFGDGFVMDSENDLYLSLADEMSSGREEVVIEHRWQTKLATNHTILQDAAAAMIGEGLPCEIDEDRIGVGNSQLGPVLPPIEDGDTPG